MKFISLNVEQEALLEKLDLSEDISIQEVIERLESLKIEDKKYFKKSFNGGVVKSTLIKSLKLNI